MMMLATTAHGDAYTFKQIQKMLESAGFHDVREKALVPLPQTLVSATR
jgi:hypothetical protein